MILVTLHERKIIPPYWNAYIKGHDISACLRSIFDYFENSMGFGIKTVMVINDIDSAFDGCSHSNISDVLSCMGIGNILLVGYGTLTTTF